MFSTFQENSNQTLKKLNTYVKTIIFEYVKEDSLNSSKSSPSVSSCKEHKTQVNPFLLLDTDAKEAVEYREVTPEDIFNLIRDLNDPEHPLTLEELSVVSLDNIYVSNVNSEIVVYFTPTIPHCSQATIIGLMIRAKLIRYLHLRFKLKVLLTKGSHVSEDAINKQLNDKERVAAALENTAIYQVIERNIS